MYIRGQQWWRMWSSLNNSNIRKKEHEKLKKHQELKEELGKMWAVKAAVVSIVMLVTPADTRNNI